MHLKISRGDVELRFPGNEKVLWSYGRCGRRIGIPAPVFEIDGQRTVLAVDSFLEISRREAFAGVMEYVLEGAVKSRPGLTLRLVVRLPDKAPFARFHYAICGAGRLTRRAGGDSISYLSIDMKDADEIREIRLSDFDELIHAYIPAEENVPLRSFDDGMTLMGPILCGKDSKRSWLGAYEHGSQPPFRFIEFALAPDRKAGLRAVRGNYCNGYDLREGYTTVWFDLGMVEGGFDELAKEWRQFVLHWMSPNTASRTPYIFYNTWNFQERQHAWEKGKYLDFMNEARMIEEIEVAHKMGIDVFVIDTGWYQKTGDWEINRQTFPHGPESSQLINIASLIFGQNGIWGDLPKISPEGVQLYGRLLGYYKQVRDEVTAAFPVRSGFVGCNPEIHEKIGNGGRGIVCAFTDNGGVYRYVTSSRVDSKIKSSDDSVKVNILKDGRVELILSQLSAWFKSG